jgi:uncharacterized protein
MVVKVEQIREQGLTLDEPISTELLEHALHLEGRDTGFRAEGASSLSALLHRVSGGVLLRGDFTARLMAPCKRCAKDVHFELPVSFTLSLVPKDLVAPDEDEGEAEENEHAESLGSFDLDDADEEVFDGRQIDLDPILREQVLLALPMDVVCGDDCKGLCPVCGQNRNEKACNCVTKVVDPRLAALKDIKLN